MRFLPLTPWPRRTDLTELMDGPDVSTEEHRSALVFLARINRWLLSRRWIAARRALPGARRHGERTSRPTFDAAASRGRRWASIEVRRL
jgi:hypothetical protein